MVVFKSFYMITAVILLEVNLSAGDWFKDEYVARTGSLRCYQCDSKQQGLEINKKIEAGVKNVGYEYCLLKNWKHANVSEKRIMMMQCPTQMTSFCMLLINTHTQQTIRGCQPNLYRGPAGYTGPKHPHPGCFYMYKDNIWYRVCLCDTDLCNSAVRLGVTIIYILTSLLTACLFLHVEGQYLVHGLPF